MRVSVVRKGQILVILQETEVTRFTERLDAGENRREELKMTLRLHSLEDNPVTSDKRDRG